MRADKFFAEKYGSRTKAQEILKEGLILRGGKPLQPKDDVQDDENVVFLADGERFASGGGKKLEKALACFRQDVSGEIAADLGASTGGFTHCLLRRGIKKVYCVDVGESLLADFIAADPRVVVMDKTNARYLTKDSFPESLSVVTGDLSFISLRLILPAVREILPCGGRAFLLFKPQFECGGKGLNGSGILPAKHHVKLLSEFYDFCVQTDLSPQNIVSAPIVPKKNVEYVIFFKKDANPMEKNAFLRRAAEISD